ncbi:MAG: phosphotriesterase [Gammaproteobacteria bacterium]
MNSLHTVTGAIAPAALGRTLMHEHLHVGFPGWETDTLHPGPARREIVALCVDRIERLKAAGYASLLDPCPADLGRDVDLMAEVATRTGFNIVCSTGLYHESLGGNAYWRLIGHMHRDAAARLAEVYVRELTAGIGATGIRAGIIKVATGAPSITDFERVLLEAAAQASNATGAPITTHTDAVLGDEQLGFLADRGVPAHRIVIGHSCGSTDHAYHMRIVDGGAYIGFDRFGIVSLQPDEVRVESLLKLAGRGALSRIVVSHDSVWCMRGNLFAPGQLEEFQRTSHPLHFSETIAPMLRRGGLSEADLDALTVENPRRFFAGDPLPALAPRA